VSEGKTFFQFANDLEEALTPARKAVIDRERKKASETMNRASTPTPERNKAYARGSRVNYLELKGLANKSDKQGSDYQVNKREHAKWRKTEKSMKEEAEQIDELSKKTLASYVQKAHDSQSEKEFLKGHSMGKKYQAAREAEKRGVSTPPSKKTPLDKKYKNREMGIGRALKRLQKD
jgi:hypothetical protein